ncbi:MAG: hypothetical protein ACHQFW_11475 [Chitinophagales bacterium]
MDIPVISYLGRVGHSSSLLFLFWIGYWNRRLGILFYLTLGLIFAIAIVDIISGGRYGPIMSALLLFLGLYFGSSPSVKWKLGLVGVMAFPVVILIAGYLERIRLLIGRSGMEDIKLERVEKISRAISKIDKAHKIIGRKESTFLSGITRNVNWVDVAVISTTDNKVPFRGSRNLSTELKNILSLAFFSSGSTREAIAKARLNKYSMGLGTGPARKYGFTVSAKSSVEWSLLSDGYSRGGPLIYLIYLMIFLFIMNGIEIIIRLFDKNQAEQKLLICVFLGILYEANALPLYESMRSIILNVVFYSMVIVIFRFFTTKATINT